MANSSSRLVQDVARTLTGVALVAREAASSSRSLDLLRRSGDLSSFASSALSRALISLSDLAGLTRGSSRRPPDPTPHPHSPRSLSPRDSSSSQRTRIPVQTPSAASDEPVAQVSSTSQHATSANSEESAIPQKHGNDEHKLSASTTVGLAWSEEEVTPKIVEGNRPRVLNSSAVPQSSKRRRPRERRVPATPLGRAFGFASLGAGIALGTLQETAKRIWGGQQNSENQGFALSPFITEQNAERLAIGLCRMRGAALKLGQMLSIQDESLLPPQVLAALETVRQGADVMPKRQLYRVITSELGPDWRSRLASFDDEPMAAASIGQVHKAVLKDGMEVAMKIQYPGVAQSIDSDIENVRRLLEFTNIIPKGLYLDQAMKVAKEELARECDYMLEAASQTRFRYLLQKEKGVYVPKVLSDFSSKRVLTTELVPGVSIDKVSEMSHTIRNSVGQRLLHLTLQELFLHRFMQTDPNWSNFLYDETTDTINLIDFGAAREYPKHFVDDYLKMVYACANQDRKNVIEMSCKLGFLTGEESTVMVDAHCEAAFMVGLPFSQEGSFDFHRSNLTRRVSELGAIMLRHRLTPPPEEAYSLHRRLSGAFLACIKLQAVVPCREMFLEVFNGYDFSGNEGNVTVDML